MDRPTVGESRIQLGSRDSQTVAAAIERFKDDERAGVRSAVLAARKRLEAIAAETTRLNAMHSLDSELRERGFAAIAGADEVGRGALAGPLTIAAVILPQGVTIEGLNDSKKLSPQRRVDLDSAIRDVAIALSIVSISPSDIDASGLTVATRNALNSALLLLDPACDHVIMDGLGVGGLCVPETAIVAGDSKCAAIAAASIVAKVHRDAYMVGLHAQHPEYGFEINKGYGTSDHTDAIFRCGLTPHHRRSFSPCGGTLPLF